MNYEEAMQWLGSREFTGMKLGLERIRVLLERLGSPEKAFRVVHVAGTNGKGSVTRMTGAILRAGGYRAGIYTSPHLVDFRERIELDGRKITKSELSRILTRIRGIAEEMEDDPETGSPTYFEIATAAAFLHFASGGAEFGVIEVGLGGRLDATNAVNPEVAVVTNISLEHTEYLGEDIRSIAREKAAIIKEGCTAVTAAEGDALEVIEERCSEKGCRLTAVGRDILIEKKGSGISGLSFGLSDGFSYDLKLRVRGDHQMKNAACAVAAAEALRERGARIEREAVSKALGSLDIEGRLEITGKDPYVVLDGAHNTAGMECLRKAICEMFPDKKVILVTAVCKDKDISSMMAEIAPAVDAVVATRHSLEKRTASPEAVARIARRHCADVRTAAGAGEAMDMARKAAGKGDVILVAGSLYLIGDVKSAG